MYRDQYIRLSQYVRVHHGDDWYPNHRGNRVHITLAVHRATLVSRVSVWGADDTGVVCEGLTLAVGLDLYVRIAHNTCPPRTSLLTRWGFETA